MENSNESNINLRMRLSALWIALMFCYTYADILGFYAPGNLAELIKGEIAGITMTQQLLFGSAVLMVVPSIMIYLCVVLEMRAIRVVNLVVAVVYLIVLASTLFTGRNPAYYIFFAAVKACLLGFIIWHTWTRKKIKFD